jgi:hypothetical protein
MYCHAILTYLVLLVFLAGTCLFPSNYKKVKTKVESMGSWIQNISAAINLIPVPSKVYIL